MYILEIRVNLLFRAKRRGRRRALIIEIRTAVFIISDLLLAELQRGVNIAEVNVGDKIEIKQSEDSVSLFVGGTEIIMTSEIKNTFLFHHRAHRALSFEPKQIFEKIVKGADFGTSYIEDIPHMFRYRFPELNERTRESYVRLTQSLSWMLRTNSLEWAVA